MKYNIKFIFLLLFLSTYSCKERSTEYEHKQQVVKAKTIDFKDGSTRYNIAFTDGSSDAFSFGVYSNYEVGDTICWERENGWYWYIVDCK